MPAGSSSMRAARRGTLPCSPIGSGTQACPSPPTSASWPRASRRGGIRLRPCTWSPRRRSCSSSSASTTRGTHPAFHEQPHRERRGVPPARAEAREKRGPRRLLIEVKGLRIERRGKVLDRGRVHSKLPRSVPLPGGEVLEVERHHEPTTISRFASRSLLLMLTMPGSRRTFSPSCSSGSRRYFPGGTGIEKPPVTLVTAE